MNASGAPGQSDAALATAMDDSDAAGTPLQRLGAALKAAREQQGLSRDALAAQLRMGPEQLAALEQGDSARLPEPVFVIAQSRRVAEALGVDVSLLLAPLKTRTAPLSSPPGRPAASTPRTASSRWLAWLALVSGAIAGGSWAWLRWQPQLQQAWAPTPPSPLAASSAATGTSKPLAATKPAAPAAPAAPAELVLRSDAPSWLEVRRIGDNAQLFEGTLKGSQRFALGTGLKVLAGRPDLVQANLGNAAAKPLGRIDQINWVSFKPQATSTTPR